MRFLTTILLIIAVGIGAVAWQFWGKIAPAVGLSKPTEADSTSALELKRITPESLIGIELNGVRLEKQGNVWNMPGEWPTRTNEVHDLVNVLTNLHSRFTPETFNHPRTFGMAADQQPVTIKTTIRLQPDGTKTHTLVFGEPTSEEGNPFVRPTYVHLDDQPEVLRLSPGLKQRLQKGREDFLRRQLFPEVVRTKLTDSRPSPGGDELPTPAIALLNAKEVSITGPDGAWTMRQVTPIEKPINASGPVTMAQDKLAGAWELTAPVVDRVDPDRLKTVLSMIPDIWVEAFLTENDPAKTGLDQPERTITVKSADRELKVLIGKVSRVKVTNPPPQPPPQMGMPPQPPPQPIREEYRFAKLPNNPQVFEIKADKFNDMFVKTADLRDPRLARYRPNDVAKIEITGPDRKLIFAKEKEGTDERWQIIEPVKSPAEGPKVMELLEKLSELQARGDAVIDSTELKNYGLADNDPVTKLTVTIRPENKEGEPAKPTQTITYRLGKTDAAKAKLYVQVAGVNRIDAINDDLLKLVDRPILAYRSRRIIDIPMNKVAKIAIERSADPYTLAQTDNKWSLVQPVAASADSAKSNSLAGDLAHLEAADFVNFNPNPDELKNYGLDEPSLKLVVTSADGASKTILIGKAREGKPEVYAKLSDQPEVFALRQTIKDAVDQSSLALRPLQLWQVPGLQVQSVEIKRADESYTLTRDGAFWKISGPFNATAYLMAVQPLAEAASTPSAEKYESHDDSDLAKYGLDKPAVTLKATVQGERPTDPVTIKEIQFGKPVVEGQPSRYAKLTSQPGVFVLGPATSDAVNKPALELLDRKLLQMDTRLITKLSGTGSNGPWSAKKEGDKWNIDSLTPAAAGDRNVVEQLVQSLGDIRATKFAAYNPTDLAQFGLDQPFATVSASLATGDQATSHTIALGKPTPDNANVRYARVDNGPAIAVLPVGLSNELGKSALDFVDRSMVNFLPKDLSAIRRTMSDQEMVLELKDGAWQMTKPQAMPADDPALFEMTERLANLRAVKVAALNAKDLKPFGLDTPTAIYTLTVKQSDGQPREIVLKLGGTASDGRFAQVVGIDNVYVLSDSKNDSLATRLLANPFKFRDRSLVKFTDADRVVITRGNRTATFAKVDGQWKMTAPITSDAEAFDLDDLVLTASRLRAEELVADQSDDMKSLGLDPPDTDVKFFQGDKQVAHLLVSKKGDDGRATVKSGDGTLVGKVDTGLSTRLLNEFRKRNLWANLDVVQVDSLILNAGAGGTPLILTKDDAGWKIAGKPDQTVRAEAVSDLLATLAGLKADRFVADGKADAKLFGLEPPVRIIVVKTRTGQTTTLNLGRFEGDSKRVYASIPGAGWVAVLNDADSAKLTQEVSAFFGK